MEYPITYLLSSAPAAHMRMTWQWQEGDTAFGIVGMTGDKMLVFINMMSIWAGCPTSWNLHDG